MVTVYSRSLPYKNKNLPTEERVTDLLARLTLAEKAGLLFHGLIYPGPGTLFPYQQR